MGKILALGPGLEEFVFLLVSRGDGAFLSCSDVGLQNKRQRQDLEAVSSQSSKMESDSVRVECVIGI